MLFLDVPEKAVRTRNIFCIAHLCRLMRERYKMKNDEVIKKIKEIISSMPEEIYKYEQPQDCFEGEWGEASNKGKAYMLIENLLINSNKEQMKKQHNIKGDLIVIKLEKIPRFYSASDENMFFNALYSIPAVKEIKGSGNELYLYCIREMVNEERKILIGLFNRYQISIPAEASL